MQVLIDLLEIIDILEEILGRTTRIVCEVMGVKACSIRLLDEGTIP